MSEYSETSESEASERRVVRSMPGKVGRHVLHIHTYAYASANRRTSGSGQVDRREGKEERGQAGCAGEHWAAGPGGRHGATVGRRGRCFRSVFRDNEQFSRLRKIVAVRRLRRV